MGMSGRGRMSKGSGVGDDWMWIGGGEWRGRKGSGCYQGVRGVWTLGRTRDDVRGEDAVLERACADGAAMGEV